MAYKKAKWIKSTIKLSNGTSFDIVHNIPVTKSNVNTLIAAMDNWLARTDNHTVESFVDYINSKDTHIAMTMEEYNKFIK